MTILGIFLGIRMREGQEEEKRMNAGQVETTDLSNNSKEEITEDSQQPEADSLLKDLMESMSLEEKVGQLFLARVPEERQIETIQENYLGGYLLFGRDVELESAESLKEKIVSYRSASKIPLFIASDEEGGTVSRLSRGNGLVIEEFKSPQEIYHASGLEGIRLDVQQKAEFLRSYGINGGLFPVADVATDPEAFIYERTLGLDAEKTSEFVTVSVEELKKQKIASTLKHFPGYGNNRDSHVEIVYDGRSLDEFRKIDFLPFKAGIKAGADSVLVSHTIISSIDKSAPASISKPVHDLLRNELGFEGVIMTDDMDMAGLADFTTQEEAGLAGLKAGNDLILSSSFETQIPYVLKGIQQGEYSEEALNQSVYRVLKMKQNIGLINQ